MCGNVIMHSSVLHSTDRLLETESPEHPQPQCPTNEKESVCVWETIKQKESSTDWLTQADLGWSGTAGQQGVGLCVRHLRQLLLVLLLNRWRRWAQSAMDRTESGSDPACFHSLMWLVWWYVINISQVNTGNVLECSTALNSSSTGSSVPVGWLADFAFRKAAFSRVFRRAELPAVPTQTAREVDLIIQRGWRHTRGHGGQAI